VRTSVDGVDCFRVRGLNIFTANQVSLQGSPNLWHLPYVRFLTSLFAGNDAWCLLGGTAIANWMNDVEQAHKRPATLIEALGGSPPGGEVDVNVYDGAICAPDPRARSALVLVRDEAHLDRLLQHFLGWDAFIFLSLPAGTPSEAVDGLFLGAGASSLGDLVRRLARQVPYVVVSEEEGLVLRVCGAAEDADARIRTSAGTTDKVIGDTEWFRTNVHNLEWSEVEGGCIVRKRRPS
jgi:hypothetical protein